MTRQGFCDGGCQGGVAAWAWMIFPQSIGTKPDSNSNVLPDPPHTNNRAELYAALNLLVTWGHESLVIHSDSQYVIYGVTKWMDGWIKNGWRTSQRRPVENQDLWRRIHALRVPWVGWKWTARDSDPRNTMVDALVNEVFRCLPSSASS